jgi:hypothetical protein
VTEAIATRADEEALVVPDHLLPRSRLGALGVGLVKVTGIVIVGWALAIAMHPWLFLAVWTATLLAWVFARRRKLVAYMRRLDDASHLLLAGDVERAATVLDALCREAKWSPTYHALFVFFRGLAELDAGRDRVALALLEAVRDSGRFGRSGFLASYRAALFANIAVAHAMLGADAQAKPALAQAHTELAAARRGTLILADAIVNARAGRHREALACVEADLEHAERLLPIRRIQIARVLQAFSVAASGGEYRSAALPSAVAEAVRDPKLRAAIDRHAARWPELAAWLATIA